MSLEICKIKTCIIFCLFVYGPKISSLQNDHSEIQLNQQIIYQTCRVQGYERSDCLLVGTEDSPRPAVQEIEAQVQPAAASVATVIVVIKSVVPAAGALLLGAWADRYGRKPVVLIAGCGESVVLLFLLSVIVCCEWLCLGFFG